MSEEADARDTRLARWAGVLIGLVVASMIDLVLWLAAFAAVTGRLVRHAASQDQPGRGALKAKPTLLHSGACPS